MMINRHNYEEFFLLYADDELNHQQRAAVELFVQQNPDMAVELEMLRQMKLEPEDNIVFPDKTMLFKTTDVEVNIHNYGEYFLLYIDKELDAHTSSKVEKFVLQHPALQEEFTLLKQTVLQPEAITFADKSSLYRREERKVGYIGFMRIAAAAALTGLALLGWWLYPKKIDNNEGPVAATHSPGAKPGVTKITPRPKTDIEPPAKQPDTGITVGDHGVKKQDNVATAAHGHKGSRQAVQEHSTPVKTDENYNVAIVTPGGIGDRPSGLPATQTAVTTITNPVATDNPAKMAEVIIPADPAGLEALANSTKVNLVPGPAKTKTPDNPFGGPGKDQVAVQRVAYKEIDTNTDDRSMYIGSLELNKDKVKGFFKLAGRLFGARPKKDTD